MLVTLYQKQMENNNNRKFYLFVVIVIVVWERLTGMNTLKNIQF